MEDVKIESEKKDSKMISYVTLVLVSLLLLFSVVQAVQISSLKQSQGVTGSAVQSGKQAITTQAISNVPAMAGGC